MTRLFTGALAAALGLGSTLAPFPSPGFVFAAAAELATAGAAPVGNALVGERFEHVVQPGEHLGLIGARYGVAWRQLASENAIERPDLLRPGQTIRVDNRHIVPPGITDGILLNVPQRMLFHLEQGALVAAYPVGLGRHDWPTPLGAFTVINRQQDKTWFVPKSIQEEMRREGKPVLTTVPPGPENPLGRHWIGLSMPAIGIHGTIAPASVFAFRSHGCIRLHADDVAQLFARVSVGTTGEIVYHPALLAALPDGRVFVEVHSDIYRRAGDPGPALAATIAERGLTGQVDAGKLAAAIRARDGIARDVTRGSNQ